MPYKTKQFFFVLIKLSIVVGAFYFIYQKLTNNSSLSFSEFIKFSQKSDVFSLKNTFFLLVLSCFNWFFEILKWQTLISSVKKLSFKNALEQSLGSLTASLFTPNRIGEYGAKAMYFLGNSRKKVLLVNLLHNSLQMLVTTVIGVAGFLVFSSNFGLQINYFKLILTLVIIVGSVILISFSIKNKKLKIKGFSFYKLKTFFLKFPKQNLFLGGFYSLVRYAVFSFQFYFLLQLFHVNIGYSQAMVIISTMYLLSSIIPSIFIFDVLIKGSIAVYLFSYAHVNELTVLSIVCLMWIFNFVIPSILGSFYVITFKFPEHDT
ncbi:flippase-like domain-containing protein [Tamlana sp. 62-3]|uniref:Flippase-like domain-containing protein n=1 Tax=Neotamlana sargassicola TaxID=2883125 RepID=A0A9X1L3Z3_9FLAO|nr:lysylphosphatidylglycerol synthase domain-containing protein [Tamlana sargassicola]MCB4807575.1 flippase-like domain-containing protein [Tamlana sargassicola]